MLKKKQRLSRNIFTALLAKGARAHGVHMTLLYRRIPEGCACGVVVSKKAWKSAVMRHAVRRRVYDTLRPSCERLDGVQFAVMLRPSAARVPLTLVLEEVRGMVGRTLVERVRDTKKMRSESV